VRQQEVQLGSHDHRADRRRRRRSAGAVGSQVTPQTLLTTIDQNETLEVNASVPIERAAALKVGFADADLERRRRAADADDQRSASCRRTPTTRRSRCW